jgi:hypothetical protein
MGRRCACRSVKILKLSTQSTTMSKAEATRFYSDVTSGKITLDAATILGKEDHGEMHEYAKSFGYDFTPPEMLEVVNDEKLHGDKELSEEQIEALVGGVNVVVVVVGVVVPVVVGAASAGAACV